ncbi:MAG: HXXEE domain-containing protein [Thermomicrobiales bacterium]
MDHDWWLWVLGTACAIHVIEEHASGWQGWASRTFGKRLGVQPTWADFTATNSALLFVAVACAVVGWRAPWFAPSLPAVCVINAVLFHVGPSIAQRYPNPGVFTAVLFYLPLSTVVYVAAHRDGVVSLDTIVWSTVVGALLMALAMVTLILGKRFHYADVSVSE